MQDRDIIGWEVDKSNEIKTVEDFKSVAKVSNNGFYVYKDDDCWGTFDIIDDEKQLQNYINSKNQNGFTFYARKPIYIEHAFNKKIDSILIEFARDIESANSKYACDDVKLYQAELKCLKKLREMFDIKFKGEY